MVRVRRSSSPLESRCALFFRLCFLKLKPFQGALTYEDAHAIASRISTSALFKTALYGEDANWGRILAATGSIPLSEPIEPSRVNVSFIPTDGTAPLPLLVHGEPEKVDEERASQIIGQEDLEIRVELGMGKESAKYWTCDFSYVSFKCRT